MSRSSSVFYDVSALCKGLVASERLGSTVDVRVRKMCTIKTGPFSAILHRDMHG